MFMSSLSRIAEIKQSIEEQMIAARRGLFGLSAGATRHEVISAKMKRVSEQHEKLGGLIGEDEAMQFYLETEARVLDQIDREREHTRIDPRSLRSIRMDAGFQTSDLAGAAALPHGTVYCAECSIPVTREEAEHILHALSHPTGQTYTLENVTGMVLKEHTDASH
jgi:hypothetical protein